MSLIQRVKNLFSPPPPPEEQDNGQEDLFKARYQAFRRLLSANNGALDFMTEMEEAALGHRHFGMHFVRSRATGATAKVFSIVEHLLLLAPGKYAALRDVLRTIQEQIQEAIATTPRNRRQELVLDLGRVTASDVDDVGGKMANLGELRNSLQVPVADGFAITSHAYMSFMRHSGLWDEINCLVLGHPMATHFAAHPVTGPDPEDEERSSQPIALLELCAKIRGMILSAEVPPELEEAILSAYDRLSEREGRQVNVALRSSALGEDSAGASFAGQHRSLLNLDRESLIDGYKEIIASKYSAHAMTYRYMLGIRDDDVLMCVGCLSMVTSKAGGVVYTANPLDAGDTRIHITSAWGVAKGVVDGTAAADRFVIEKLPQPRIAERFVPRKESALVCSPTEGVCRISVDPEMCDHPTLEDRQLLELAGMAERIETHYGVPQDIEWAFTPSGRLVLLQTRPLEVREAARPADSTVPAQLPAAQPLLRAGHTASAGTAHGVVHFVRKDVDILVLPENAILVCVEAAPKWAAVLNRCQGIITEQGSVAGHLANVAREFRVPALFGVADAASLLSPGQEITLDADNAAVYAGELPEILDRKPQRPNMMEGSPVFQTLKRVNQFITPLHLLNPDTLDFTPSNCRTLHDITRFCHEKSVQEMFSFGRDHNFSPRSSKQLKTVVPMQWWIINLEDGFKKEVAGKLVPLDNIASVPMLALWRGIVAFPWEGPPSLDGKGFMSVLFQSATNTNLEPANASSYAEKNYFMISKHFCNLQSRFGYHFTSAEALAGPRPRENYIRFQFKGGAADQTRRVRRARFVGEILDEFNFQTRVREDALFARLDDCDQQFIESHLEIIGHLLIHTRQLDMIMNNEDVVQFYKQRILNQLRSLLDAKTTG